MMLACDEMFLGIKSWLRPYNGYVGHLMAEELPCQSPSRSGSAELLALAKFTFAIDATGTSESATPRR
ncbi:hypothetical protein SAMN05192563_105217 [Paraburkholderia aspalathi]|uniref:Uncharacterized protein n=1 Tax=Paraburkholderia aspalathi TaxID=1324617 RepID=A0A1I7ER00_9BURK|nr:hypothetical protein SAMN05192563_105217 [Paraburkholderia aspalathi]